MKEVTQCRHVAAKKQEIEKRNPDTFRRPGFKNHRAFTPSYPHFTNTIRFVICFPFDSSCATYVPLARFDASNTT